MSIQRSLCLQRPGLCVSLIYGNHGSRTQHLVPEPRPVLACSGAREDLPVGTNKTHLPVELKTTAVCGQLSSSSACL